MHMRRRSATLVFVLLLTSLVAAWGGSAGAASTAGTRVRPFSEVQASDLQFERDRSDPTRGIFRVETTEPMICAIVWGTDKSFGRFNNSLAMNGTGITDHDVILPDVKPGVTYSYVVQGTTADGTLYRSKVGTFKLEAGSTVGSPKSVDGLRNAALGATVTQVSSEFSTSFAAGNAVDGDTATEWATKGDGDQGSITLDLGAPTEIASVDFVTRSMADGTATTSRYTVAIDGGQPLGLFRAGTVARPRPFEIGSTGRVLRFDVARSTGGNVGAVEIRIYTTS